MTSLEDLPSEERKLWPPDMAQDAADSSPKTSNQKHFHETYYLPSLEDVGKTVTENMEKNRDRAKARGRSAMANPPSRDP